MPLIKVRGASFKWGGRNRTAIEAFRDIDLDVGEREFVVIIGPSGSGKSSLLHCMAGLNAPTTGTISIAGAPAAMSPKRALLLFQYAFLFPWLTVRANVGMGQKFRHGRSTTGTQRKEHIVQLLNAVGLAKWADLYPGQLSGGMRQRVALARALANEPSVLLLDEPFSALDYQSRLQMSDFLLSIWKTFGITMVFVTHSIDEAILLADRIVVMEGQPGRIREIIDVRQERPRHLASDAFNSLRGRLLELLIEPNQDTVGKI